MTTMLEKAARALSHLSSHGEMPGGVEIEIEDTHAFAVQARAVLLAIREADDRMLNAAFNEMNMTPGRTWKAMKAAHASEREIFHAKHKPRYTAMIDAILNEKTT